MNTQTKSNGIFGDKVQIAQPENGYRAGIDPLFLASLGEDTGHCLDLGCGVGTVLLALKHRCPKITGLGIEIQPLLAELARKNIKNNNFSDDLSVLEGDFKSLKKTILPTSFDQVFINPPYFETGAYFKDENTRKAMANHEGETGYPFGDWLSFANYALKPKGFIYIIHRTERLDDILSALAEKSFGGTTLYPLWPKANTASKLILIRAQKGSKTNLRLHSGMVLHDNDGGYTDEATNILLHGKSFEDALKKKI